jgi:hypothetical protein
MRYLTLLIEVNGSSGWGKFRGFLLVSSKFVEFFFGRNLILNIVGSMEEVFFDYIGGWT